MMDGQINGVLKIGFVSFLRPVLRAHTSVILHCSSKMFFTGTNTIPCSPGQRWCSRPRVSTLATPVTLAPSFRTTEL